jgi:hypothetical protein
MAALLGCRVEAKKSTRQEVTWKINSNKRQICFRGGGETFRSTSSLGHCSRNCRTSVQPSQHTILLKGSRSSRQQIKGIKLKNAKTWSSLLALVSEYIPRYPPFIPRILPNSSPCRLHTTPNNPDGIKHPLSLSPKASVLRKQQACSTQHDVRYLNLAFPISGVSKTQECESM